LGLCSNDNPFWHEEKLFAQTRETDRENTEVASDPRKTRSILDGPQKYIKYNT
jgi:hypothetical protein